MEVLSEVRIPSQQPDADASSDALAAFLTAARSSASPPLCESSAPLVYSSLRGSCANARARRLACALLREAAATAASGPGARSWDALACIVESALDQPLHLLLGLWAARAPDLFGIASAESVAGGAVWDASECVEPAVSAPALSEPPPLPWALLAVEALVAHPNPATARGFQLLLLRDAAGIGTVGVALADSEISAESMAAREGRVAGASGADGGDSDGSDTDALALPPALCSYAGACSYWDSGSSGGPSAMAGAAAASRGLLLSLPAWFALREPLIGPLSTGCIFASGGAQGSHSAAEGAVRVAFSRMLEGRAVSGSCGSGPADAVQRSRRLSVLVEGGLRAAAACRPVLRALLAACLTQTPRVPAQPTATLGIAHLAVLRDVCISASLECSRAFSARVARDATILALRLTVPASRDVFSGTAGDNCGGLVVGSAGSVPIADMALTVALVPSAVADGLGEYMSLWLRAAPGATGGGGLLLAAVDEYVAPRSALPTDAYSYADVTPVAAAPSSSTPPRSSTSATPLCAVGLSRLLAAYSMHTTSGSTPSLTLSAVLAPAASALIAASNAYTPRRTRVHALLLAAALSAGATGTPGDADAHLARSVISPQGGGGGPPPDTLLEFENALRAGAVAGGRKESGPAAPADAPAVAPGYSAASLAAAREAVRSALCAPGVAVQLAPFIAAELRVLSGDTRSSRPLSDATLLCILRGGGAAARSACGAAAGDAESLEAFRAAAADATNVARNSLRAPESSADAIVGAAQRIAACVGDAALTPGPHGDASALTLELLGCLRSPAFRGASGATRASLATWSWASLARIVRATTTVTVQFRENGFAARPSLSAALGTATASALAQAALTGLEGASDASAPSILAVVARFLPECPISEETAASTLTDPLPSLPSVLSNLERFICGRGPARARASYAHYAAAVATPSLLLLVADAAANPLFSHLSRVLTALTSPTAPAGALAPLAARLSFALVAVAATGDAAPRGSETRAAAKAALALSVPHLVSLALAPTSIAAFDDPPFLDDASRRALARWRSAVSAQRAAAGGDAARTAALSSASSGVPDPGALLAISNSHILGVPPPALPSLLEAANISDSADDAGLADLAARGAGGVSRVSALCGIDELCACAARARGAAHDGDSDDAPSVSFVRQLARALVALHSQPLWADVSQPLQPGRPLHLLKLRAWQALVLVGGRLGEGAIAADTAGAQWTVGGSDAPDGSDAELAISLSKFAFALLSAPGPPQLASLRHYAEVLAVAVSRRFPVAVASAALLPALAAFDSNTQHAFAAALAGADALIFAADRAQASDATPANAAKALGLSRTMIRALLPWTAGAVGLVRVVAAAAVSRAADVALADAPGADLVAPLVRMVRAAPDVAEQVRKARASLARVAPETAASLHAVLSSPVSEHGELLPRDTVSYVIASFRAVVAARVEREPATAGAPRDEFRPARAAAQAAGLVPTAAAWDQVLAWPWGVEGGSAFGGIDGSPAVTGAGGEDASSTTGHGNVQLKPTRADVRASDAPRAVLTDMCVGADGAPRRAQPLIIFASLVDKIPNLGGLARTGEVFGASALIVPDARVTADPLFQFTSLDAEQLLPIFEVRPNAAKEYLRARRAEGWAVVALEQAARSLRLGAPHTHLPDRVVLLLGAEKEGVPPELLAEADFTVEIPQLGVLRSLNVHVSAALVVWEYTRQRIERSAAAAAAVQGVVIE